MGIFRFVKRQVSGGFNVSQWVGANVLKKDTKNLKNLITSVYKMPKVVAQPESFSAYMHRLGITPADLQKRVQTGHRVVLGLLSLAGGLLLYAVYLWYKGLHNGTMISILLSLVLCSYAFREHFTLFQMKQQRLNCSVTEWFRDLLKRAK